MGPLGRPAPPFESQAWTPAWPVLLPFHASVGCESRDISGGLGGREEYVGAGALLQAAYGQFAASGCDM